MQTRVQILGLALCLLCSKAFSAPDLTGFTLDFVDEFNGTELDPALWNTSPLWGPYVVTGNNEEQYYVDTQIANPEFPWSPFSLANGILTITAQPVSDDNVPAAPPQPPLSDSLWQDNPEYNYNPTYTVISRKYLSGIITSSDTFNFTHGYAEIRAKIPAGQGLWPAFWQLTTKYVEDVPEIDIMEALGQNPNEVYHSLHYYDTSNDWQLISSPTYKTEGPDFTQDYHTYSVMWEPKKIIWYVDGVEVKRLDDSGDLLIPKQAMYLIANLAVGGNWPGSPDDTTPFPAQLKIDHIKVYRKDMPTPVTPAILNSDYQLMFFDEFEGDELDASKWKTSHLWGPYLQINSEEQIYIDKLGRHQTHAVNPITISDGTLKITAQEILQADLPVQEDSTDLIWDEYPAHNYNADYNTPTGWNPAYTSGLISSYDNFKFISGYAEMSAKLPAGDGLWPAFWLLNGYYVGPQPEIDIMEAQGEQTSTIHQSYHYYNNIGQLVSLPDSTTFPAVDYSEGFHTYAVEWDSDYIKWYVDGVVTRELESANSSKQLMYVIANLAVGGSFVGPVNSTFPKEFEIDYIRIYQLKNSNQVQLPTAEPLVLNRNEWNIVSIPATLAAADYTVANVFADDMPGVYGTDWTLFEYDTENRAYQNPGLTGTLERGQGYWIIQISADSVVVDMPASAVEPYAASSITGCATVKCIAYTPLTSGGVREWHMAGNAFTENMNSGNVRVVTDTGTCQTGCTLIEAASEGLVYDKMYAYRGGPAYDIKQDQEIIKSWSGFWLATLESAHENNAVILFSD